MPGTALSSRLNAGRVSATSQLSETLSRIRGRGGEVIDLSQGEVADVPPAPYVQEAAVRAIREHKGKYTPAAGLPQLRQAIADWFGREQGVRVTPRGAMASPGAKFAVYSFLMAVLEPGDDVLIPVPYWTSYPDQVRLAGGTPRFLPTTREGGFKVTAQALRDASSARTRVLVLNNPTNPTGAVYTRRELEALLDEVLARDLFVLSDEVYSELTYDGAVHQSFAALHDEAASVTVTVNAASKMYCMTGWRLGFVAGPERVIAAMEQVQSHTTSCPNSIAQWAAVAALTGDQDPVVALRRRLDERRRLAVDALAAVPGTDCPTPLGGLYVFPSARRALDRYGLHDSDALVAAMLEATGVLAAPGVAFGVPDRLRLCFGAPLPSVRDGIARMLPWLAGAAGVPATTQRRKTQA